MSVQKSSLIRQHLTYPFRVIRPVDVVVVGFMWGKGVGREEGGARCVWRVSLCGDIGDGRAAHMGRRGAWSGMCFCKVCFCVPYIIGLYIRIPVRVRECL